ncbi:MAG: hypothetical protein KC621_00590 [Myxococcales bacterium]|nr:hypothetical protein [Myxococcales bacterium]
MRVFLLLIAGCSGSTDPVTPTDVSETGDLPPIPETDLLQTPGASGTLSAEAAAALAWCTANWQADARVVAANHYDFGFEVVAFSASDPGNVCSWTRYTTGFEGQQAIPGAQYAPGWIYDTTTDAMVGWAVDSDAVAAQLGFTHLDFFMAVNPAGHRRQYGWDAELQGVPDDVPVILAAPSMADPDLHLLDGRTGAEL